MQNRTANSDDCCTQSKTQDMSTVLQDVLQDMSTALQDVLQDRIVNMLATIYLCLINESVFQLLVMPKDLQDTLTFVAESAVLDNAIYSVKSSIFGLDRSLMSFIREKYQHMCHRLPT